MILNAGSIQLRSGKWQWELLGGDRMRWLHFVMEGQPDQQMLRPLVSEATVDNASAARFASHPGTRVWVSPERAYWLIHDLSYLARWRRQGPREVMLIDESGEPSHLEITESTELGQMTDAEIEELVRSARRPIASDETTTGRSPDPTPPTPDS